MCACSLLFRCLVLGRLVSFPSLRAPPSQGGDCPSVALVKVERMSSICLQRASSSFQEVIELRVVPPRGYHVRDYVIGGHHKSCVLLAESVSRDRLRNQYIPCKVCGEFSQVSVTKSWRDILSTRRVSRPGHKSLLRLLGLSRCEAPLRRGILSYMVCQTFIRTDHNQE